MDTWTPNKCLFCIIDFVKKYNSLNIEQMKIIEGNYDTAISLRFNLRENDALRTLQLRFGDIV